MTEVFSYLLPLTTYLFLSSSLASCSESTSEADVALPDTPSGGKELIAFSGDGKAFTRAAMTRGGFTSETKVVARIKAEGASNGDVRYTETVMKAGTEVTSDDCNTGYGLPGAHSHLSYVEGKKRYWDDAFGRASKLTVYALCIPNNNTTLSDNILNQSGTPVDTDKNPDWYTTGSESTTVSWTVSAQQSADTRQKEDIAYSNNIRAGEQANKGRYIQTYDSNNDTWVKSMGYGRLQWDPKTTADGETTGKFDQGHLVFRHALTWIEIKLNEGDGFDHSSPSDFAWTGSAQNITLKGFPTSGSLDVSTGEWSGTSTGNITQMDETTPATPASQTTRTLHCYVLPGTNLYSNSSSVIEFEIDQTKYYVTGTQIAEAIRNFYKNDATSPYHNFTTTEAGKHYIINLIVGKRKIDDMTAAILEWETVNSSDAVAKNTYATFDFEDRTERVTEDKFNIYRAAAPSDDYIMNATTGNYEWKTGYTVDGKAAKSFGDNKWTTTWTWPDNKTFYYFRAAGLNASGDVTITQDATNGDYFNITSGTLSGSNYKDYLWGAPFTYRDNTYKIRYDNTDGFSKDASGAYQISSGLPATESQIKMLLFHMTSQITVNVKTTTDIYKVMLQNDAATTDAAKYTKVEILNILPDGKVLMGTGAVSTTSNSRTEAAEMGRGTYTAENGTTPAQVSFSYGIVPQALTYSGGTIGLRITTPDGNQYMVRDLSTCKATVTNQNLLNPYTVASGGLYTINAWYPHYQYNYTVTLKKSGIQNITASVVPWETVTGDLGEITLEN